MKRRKEICERFGFSSYLTLNHESEVYVRAEDLPVFNETVRRGFSDRFYPLVKGVKMAKVSVCKTCSQRLSLLI